MTAIRIYTDGACRGNPGPGGWGALLITEERRKEIYGGERLTTNNRMELMGAIQGLSALKRPCEVTLYSDSKYVLNGISEWLADWKARGWKTSAKKPVKNQDLWEQLDAVVVKHRVSWEWVRGHAGHPENERADALANLAIDELLKQDFAGHHAMRQIVLDTETTGLEVGANHRVIEIGCIEIVNRRVTSKTFHRYLNPDREIDKGAFEVHGISRERLASEPRYADIDAEFIEFIRGAELLIHNAPFDVAFLNAEFSRIPSAKRQIADICTVLDTLALARRMHPGQRNNLDALCKRYSIDNSHRDFHGALLDARILSDVYLAMTGGQVTLVLGAELDSDLSRSRRAPTAGENAGKRAVVRLADDAELAAHEHVLDRLDKASGGKTLWRQAAAEPARA